MSGSTRVSHNEGPTVLITGTTGFVGSHLARGLRRRYQVLEVNRRGVSDRDPTLVWDFCSEIPSSFPGRADVVIHCASPVGSGPPAHERACLEVNVGATGRLLTWALEAGTKLFVFISSGAVYGLAAEPRRESDPLRPDNAYGCSKASAEFLVQAHQRHMRTLRLRLFYPYGPGQKPPRLVPGLIERITSGQPVTLHGPEARPRMNPLFIDDLLSWVIRLLDTDGASGTYNLGGTEILSVRELADRLGSLLGCPTQFQYRDTISGNTIGDISRACADTGFSPQWTLGRGLEEVVRRLGNHRPR